MNVSRETVADTVHRFQLAEPAATADALYLLLEALAAEPDPPTTVRDPAQALDVHIADSLTGLDVRGLRNAARIADLGAGAGFPGLVLAAALPKVQVDLVESARRKCEVITRLAEAAGLQTRARAIPVRAEEWAAGDGKIAYDAVTARALAPLPVICEYAAPLLHVGGVLVAWKGARQAAEEHSGLRAAAELGLGAPEVFPAAPYPGSRNHHLYVYPKVTETSTTYPRRVGVAAKKPLG
jgi:16S rRNA (guanine527-N7)-methyltransferase